MSKMIRFNTHCLECRCEKFTLKDNCICVCHESLKEIMKETGLSFDIVVMFMKDFQKQIEAGDNELALDYLEFRNTKRDKILELNSIIDR